MSKSLVKNSAFNVIYRLSNVVFPLIIITYVSKVLGPAGIGKVDFAQNIVSYFTLAATLGLPAYGIRQVVKEKSDLSNRSKVFSELFFINLISTVFFLGLYFIIVNTFSIFQARLEYHLIFSTLIIFNCFNIEWFYQGLEEFGYIAVRNVCIKVISLVALFILVRNAEDCIWYACVVCFSTVGAYILNVIIVGRYTKLTFKGLNLKRHLGPIFILFATTIAAEFYSKIDVTMLGVMFETQKADVLTGYYSNSFKLVNMLLTVLIAITASFLPRLSKYYHEDKEKFCDLVNTGLKILIVIGTPMFVGINLLVEPIVLTFFDVQFFPAVNNTIRFLSPLLLIKGIGDLMCYQVLLCAGKEKLFLISALISAGLNITLNSILIPVYEQDGAAVASVISELVYNAILMFTSLKIVKVRLNFKFILSVLLANLAMAVAVYLFNLLKFTIYVKLLLAVLIGVIVYALVIILTKNELISKIIFKKQKNNQP